MKFKSKKVEERFVLMEKIAQKIAIAMDEWLHTNYGLEITLTETWTTGQEDAKLNRQSDTHRTGRAFDVRTRDIPEWILPKLIEFANVSFNERYGALTPSGPRLIFEKLHGSGPHLHVQVRRNLRLAVKDEELKVNAYKKSKEK